MARVYLFNMIDRDRYGTSLSLNVNSSAQPYNINNTYAAINFVPFSTSGALVGGGQPQGNAFIASNQILARDSSGGLHNLFSAVATPGQMGDLLAFISPMDIALYAQSGVFLAAYSPTGNSRSGDAPVESDVKSSGASVRRFGIALLRRIAALFRSNAAAPAEPVDSVATNFGNVYIFNIFSQDITVSSNGGTIGTIPAWSDGSGTVPPYTPDVAVTQRVINQSSGQGKIANGGNRLQVTRLEQPGTFGFTVDGNQFPVNQNLMLFIAKDHWRLATQFGQIVQEGAINPLNPGQNSSPTTPQKEEDMENENAYSGQDENLNTAAGNVYVFNVTSQDLSLSTNGLSTGAAILGWSQSGTTKYQPNVQAVPRVLNASDSPGKFWNGNNNLSLSFIDGLFSAQVKIDGSVFPLNQDLLLLIERNKWQLVNQFAVNKLEGDVIPFQVLREALDQLNAMKG